MPSVVDLFSISFVDPVVGTLLCGARRAVKGAPHTAQRHSRKIDASPPRAAALPQLETHTFSGDRYIVTASTIQLPGRGFLLKWTADPAVHEDFNTNGLVKQRVGWSVVGDRLEQLGLFDDLMVMAGMPPGS